jgi:hypothetical protein
MIGRGTLAVVLGLLVLGGASSTGAQSKCVSGKMKALGKKESAKLGCHAKAAATGDTSSLAACLSKAESKFSTAVAKADTAGPCSGNVGACECLVDRCVTAVRNDLPDDGKCESARLKAAGKKAKGVLGCAAKAAAKSIPVDSGCVQKAKDKFAAAFVKTSGCTGSQGTVESDVDGDCVDAVGGDSAGGAMVGTVCDTGGTPAPSCITENQPCGSCGSGICVTACGCGNTGLICLANATFNTPGCATDKDCPAGNTCALNTLGGGCGSGVGNGCAQPCP